MSEDFKDFCHVLGLIPTEELFREYLKAEVMVG